MSPQYTEPFATPLYSAPSLDYNVGMAVHVDAVYEGGVLRPLQPLDLREHEHVTVTVTKHDDAPLVASTEFSDVASEATPPGIEVVRARLSRITESMASAVALSREDR